MAAQVPGCEEKWPTEQPIKVTLFAINYFGNGANSDRRAAQTYLLTYFTFSGIFTMQTRQTRLLGRHFTSDPGTQSSRI